MKRKFFVWPVIFTLAFFFTGLLVQTASGGPRLSFTGYGWDCYELASIAGFPPPTEDFGTGESVTEYELNLQFKGKKVTGTLEWTSHWDGGSRDHIAVLESGRFENGWLSFVVSYQVVNTEVPNCPYDYSRDQFNLVWIDEGDGTVKLQGGVVGFADFDCGGSWDASELVAVELYSD